MERATNACEPGVLSWWLSIATGLAAVGGGTILLRGLALLPLGTATAFLIGGCISLGVVKLHAPHRAGMMAAVAAGLTAVLLCLHGLGWVNLEEKLESWMLIVGFSSLLCSRYAFWFAARILRTDVVAGHEQKLARLEVAHYVGLIGGFALGQYVVTTFESALVLDATLGAVAAGIDYVTRNRWSAMKAAGRLRRGRHGAGADGAGREVSIYLVTVVACASIAAFVALGNMGWSAVWAIGLLCVGAIAYEILATVVLDSIGDDERKRGESVRANGVARAYCCMAIMGAGALWGLTGVGTGARVACALIVPGVVWGAFAGGVESAGGATWLWERKTAVLVVLTVVAQMIPFAMIVGGGGAIEDGYILIAMYGGGALGGVWSSVKKATLVAHGGGVGTHIRW